MRINDTLSSFYSRPPQITVEECRSPANTAIPRVSRSTAAVNTTAADIAPLGPGKNQSRPGIIVDISPEGWAAYARANAAVNTPIRAPGAGGTARSIAALDLGCQTCRNRKYKDVSNDPSVSFQTATHISPGQAASAVMAHEGEHVSHEQAKAEKEGREVISQTVTLETSICPECGRVYVSGGVTRTITADTNSSATSSGGGDNGGSSSGGGDNGGGSI